MILVKSGGLAYIMDCLSADNFATINLICGSNPISNILSASSSTEDHNRQIERYKRGWRMKKNI